MQIRSTDGSTQDRHAFAPAWRWIAIVGPTKGHMSRFIGPQNNVVLSKTRQSSLEYSLFTLAYNSAAVIVLCLHLNMSHAAAGTQTKARLIISQQIFIIPNRLIPFPIQYETAGSLPRQTFIKIRNLPLQTSLTEGYRVSDTTWVIPLDRRLNLQLLYSGKLPAKQAVRIELVSLDGEVYAEASVRFFSGITPPAPPTLASQELKHRSKLRQQAEDMMFAMSDLSIGSVSDRTYKSANADASRAGAASQAKTSAPVSDPPASAALPQDRQEAKRLVAKGNEFLLQGNINIARLFYRRAADFGFADAAMALAATFDPNELSGLGIVEMYGDKDQALHWYKRAAELGEPAASERLRRLLK